MRCIDRGHAGSCACGEGLEMTRPIKLTPEQIAGIARALADPRRFAIFEQIARCDGLACSALSEHQAISPATVSHHLKELSEAGLIDAVRYGRRMNLSVCRSVWDAYVKRLQKL
jgi:ArsR family transcriptional regulator